MPVFQMKNVWSLQNIYQSDGNFFLRVLNYFIQTFAKSLRGKEAERATKFVSMATFSWEFFLRPSGGLLRGRSEIQNLWWLLKVVERSHKTFGFHSQLNSRIILKGYKISDIPVYRAIPLYWWTNTKFSKYLFKIISFCF